MLFESRGAFKYIAIPPPCVARKATPTIPESPGARRQRHFALQR